jgi:hypothetical protein
MGRVTVVTLLVLSLGGCAVFGGPADKALRRSPSYRDGYQDGCAAANDQGSNLRTGPLTDNGLYKTDSVYRTGWGNGYQTCRRIQTPGVQANTPADHPIPDISPGHQ